MATGRWRQFDIWLHPFIVFYLLTTNFPLFSQSSHKVFEHLTTEYGLSSNKVEAVVQDDDGFYWIATQNGLNRFDGTNFKIYRHQPDDTTSLTHNNCTAILKDKLGDIWIATYNGVSRYRKRTNSFQRIFLQYPRKNQELVNRIYHLAVDSTGNVWIAGNGLWQYNASTNQITLFQSNEQSLNGKPVYNVIHQLHYDRSRHGLWLSTGNGVIFFNITDSKFFHSAYNPHKWKVFDHSRNNEFTMDQSDNLWFRDQESQCIASFNINRNEVIVTPFKITSGIRQLQADDQNRIWLFYYVERSLILDPASMMIDSSFFGQTPDRSILSEQATSFYIDHDDNYWITSGNGISIFGEANQYYRLYQLRSPDHSGEQPMRIQALAQSQPGYLWVGTAEGLYRYNLQSGGTKKISFPSVVPGVTTLLAEDNKVWIGAHDQLTCIDANSHHVLYHVQLQPGIIFVKRDDMHHVWIGQWTRGLFQLDEDGTQIKYHSTETDSLTGIKHNSLISAYSDTDQLWIGYNAGMGFSSLSTNTGEWKHYHPDIEPTAANMVHAGTVTAITRDHFGHLWIGTHGGGMFSFDPATQSFSEYSQTSGLNSNYINSILADTSDRLWIATSDGMNIMDVTSHSIRSLDMNVSFHDNDFRQNGLSGQDGKLYFFFNDKVIEIDPALYDPKRTPGRMVISSFTVFDTDRQLPLANEPIILSYNENFFSFGFSVIKTHPLQQMQYAYRIKGFDKDWIYTDMPFANYTNVPHGQYNFQVKAMNDNGEWSGSLIDIPMRIYPPFWKTWWFILLVVFVGMAGVYGLYRYRIGQIKKVMTMRARISRDLHDEVGSALSSIHVYSSVAEKSMEKNPQATRDALHVIYENTRQVMENMSDIVWAINSADQGGLSIEKKIKNYGFELLTPLGIVTTYTIDPEVEQKLLHMEARRNVLLITKEAMNNIARYSQASSASIEMRVVDYNLQLRIQDNGIGFDHTDQSSGNGLSNMQKRSASLGGKCDIQTGSQQGTTITCHIPVASIRDI